MENLEGKQGDASAEGSKENESFENKIFESEQAVASITVNYENRHVYINDLRSTPKNQGYGSRLLDKLKATYPDYTISGQAAPS